MGIYLLYIKLVTKRATSLDSHAACRYYATDMTVLVFIKDLVLATLGQLASLFGGIFVFGLLIHLVSRLIFRSLEKSFGRTGTYLVAWLGTPVHELGHVIFCLVFFHRIVEVGFFKPDPQTGTLGYVYHRWDRRNPWHILGNFFIGIGPVILGCAVLLALFYFLVPGSSRAWDTVLAGMSAAGGGGVGGYLAAFGDSSLAMVKLIFAVPNLATWQFWVFLYLSICVAANIRLSLADARGSLSGLGCVVLPFFIFNFIALLAGAAGGDLFPATASWLGAVYGLLILALVMVIIGFVLTYPIAAVYYRLKYRAFLNPL